MTSSKFSPAPGERATGIAKCEAPGHGQYETKQVEQFDGGWKATECPRCRWEALNLQCEDSVRDAAYAEKEAEELNRDLFATGITPRFRGCTFDSFITNAESAKVRAQSICRRYAEEFEGHYRAGRALMLLGEVGNGKTHLSCAILQHVVREYGAKGLIVTAEAIMQAVTDSFRSNVGPSKSDLLAELAAVDLLVIDEVGMHTPRDGKDFMPSLLHEVIDRRYQLVRPTVLISNQEREQLPKYIGPRAMDRLRENGGLLAPFTWSSARVGGGA
ncbi:ATP-binding protein [Pseudomonas putida]|uniref:ATP-binding protein n=1 Tax=Pseudomonas promysalinigenes TaxID=485898 RepID=A0ABY6ASQ3_9PSED|nr:MULTISPECIES: ATP-binding protein [Pseudomonas]MBH3451655.1 ATP-binding protein [Pseudomonas putida]MBH3469745.1 ATP-binding protein [Pseudomonas putida]MBS5845977.1 ATP-binding protein [Pseudomonas putida]MCE0964543.1 ATP-binding protein [Pseudomonas sp. NMI4491_12]UXH41231.1 ATP-binding protein [Pseudomonas promysalinigenes]